MYMDNQAVLHRFFAAFDEGKSSVMKAIDELISPDYVLYDATAGVIKGRDGLRQLLQGFFSAIPDFWMKLEQIIVEGDRAAYQFSFGGTHRGELMGYPATGKQVQSTCICLGRFRNGQIVEETQIWDAFGLSQQLTTQTGRVIRAAS